ncbi:nicotinate (nicotinamide) nucleotide adenylyltransferase [Helicobacter turcicus]|uniref:Probable nicotinate-nucleotide adenylyltransferase n=1 Tax=Helicobacter turcicus TaxID=2867412 RepID=A0ABS7JLM3_9HELI|nr:nicotinate (nicotinamide) nucleotide adenylyltransferase [Helicobacter turcicus]MBX7490271.1 nicotinate (nicotinamide) nucleotide adenylyltransferase [Helicobacter turcicus]MBX7545150.1 nicotinate (nicotinamide) nucleotide adenylyltransferase [Helicobacter turcicus]
MQKRIGIFGGSFDPPHNGHLEIIKSAILQLKLDMLFVVPSFLNPFKSAFYFSPKVRLTWLEQLVESMQSEKSKIKVLDFEVRQDAPTPTFKTLKYILDSYDFGNEARYFLLLGADNVESLPKWAEFTWLEKNIEFVIIPRNGYAIPKNYATLKFQEILISATQLRQMLEIGKCAALKDWIPHTILESVIKEANCKKIEKH